MTRIVVILAIVLLSSCVTQRRCLEKFPPVSTVDTIEHIVWIDTTIYVPLPGDTIIDSVYFSDPVDLNEKPIMVKTRFSTATAWIENSFLYLELVNNDTLIAYTIDSIASTKTKTITVTNEHIKPVKFIPLIYRVALFVSIGFIIFAILLIFINLR